MLRSLAVSFFFIDLFVNMSLQASNDAWIKDMKQKAQEAALEKQSEAQQIVQQAQKAAQKYKKCPVVHRMIKDAHQSVRKVMESEEDSTPKYPDLLVFVSFSMPIETLKVLGKQVSQKGGKLVFRGLVEGSFSKMAQKLKEIETEALIDPTLFEEHRVTAVPTFIQGKDRLTGNVSLPYVMKKFKEGDGA